jgi:hypothetical protein
MKLDTGYWEARITVVNDDLLAARHNRKANPLDIEALKNYLDWLDLKLEMSRHGTNAVRFGR